MDAANLDSEQSAGQSAGSPYASRRVRRVFVHLGLWLTAAYVAWCGAMYFYQDKLIFPRDLAPAPQSAEPAGRISVVTITTEDGRTVPAWFVRSSAANPGPAVLYFHGNAEIIDFEERVTSIWRSLGVSVLMPEYRGYGRAKDAGAPSEAALVADGVRFFDELLKRPEVDPSRIIIQGYSIGGGVAAQVAARRKPAALILEATFCSIADFAWGYGVPPFLVRHPFHTDEVLPTLGVPIFISHGRADTIVPIAHGRRLHELVPGSTYLELDCGHLNMPGDRASDGYREEIHKFLVKGGIL